MKKAAGDAKLTYRVEDDGKITFVLNNANVISSGSVDAATLELTDRAGETISIEMEIYQPKTDPTVFWCLAKTDYKESDIRGMKGEAFFSVKGFAHYSMATWFG